MNERNATKFILELANKRQKFIDASRENDFEEGLARWLSQQYPDNAHFLYELLQNAEDAQATFIRFELYQDLFLAEHNGHPFSQKNVNDITGIGNTEKKDDPNAIGEFGIGFKAVFQYTNTPAVYSPPFAFKIWDLVLPEVIPADRALPPKHTRFVFPFNKPEKPCEEAHEEIALGLQAFSETAILFLSSCIRKYEDVFWVESRAWNMATSP